MTTDRRPRPAGALFHEKRYPPLWLRLVVLFSGLTTIAAGVLSYTTGDEGPAGAIVAALIGLLIVAVLLPVAGVVLVADDMLLLSLRPFNRRTIAAADISDVEQLGEVSGMFYGGVGWRRTRSGRVLIMGRGTRVRVRTTSGEDYVVVTRRADELLDALRRIAR
ncbi:hypothetical protein FHR81_003684 [Actinoalloteichus hoggarensis]|uniref:Uncharacterized protein n=1 Tax=Actinoalloteichus hoggarensis TaxID=1470176 RepID=A0A221WAM0_9PSEU|nr:hypothetical protein [Actinoalloteichus hoggarensis]ASO23022.1 hypothetical protein AHOG_27120 [Actinoalloteichus hoggarensis]MBB5922627.1 hypothetical protein [Actinoalloteichus hoggarensis]